MKSTHTTAKLSRVAQFVGRRINELRSRRSQAEIAAAAGFRSPNMLSMIKDGSAKLPIDRVEALARALECDPGHLMRLTLEQLYPAYVIEAILAATRSAPSIEAHQDHTTHGGAGSGIPPKVIEEIERDLDLIEAPPRPSRQMDEISSSVVAMSVEVVLGLRELKFARQSAKNALSSADRVNARLSRIQIELGALLEVVKGEPTHYD